MLVLKSKIKPYKVLDTSDNNIIELSYNQIIKRDVYGIFQISGQRKFVLISNTFWSFLNCIEDISVTDDIPLYNVNTEVKHVLNLKMWGKQ